MFRAPVDESRIDSQHSWGEEQLLALRGRRPRQSEAQRTRGIPPFWRTRCIGRQREGKNERGDVGGRGRKKKERDGDTERSPDIDWLQVIVR